MHSSTGLENFQLEASWKALLKDNLTSPYFQDLSNFVREEYAHFTCFPPFKSIFAAFDHCPVNKVRVVILGQDPYHGEGQANGLCFSVADGVAIPPSLRNIFKEIASDVGMDAPKSGNLEPWAKQGVLLLNATLSVRAHEAASHQKQGWEIFTDAAISRLAQRSENIVFLLWGAYAQKKVKLIPAEKHLILSAPHPSPLSAHRGFFGCKHFSKANHYLAAKGLKPIEW